VVNSSSLRRDRSLAKRRARIACHSDTCSAPRSVQRPTIAVRHLMRRPAGSRSRRSSIVRLYRHDVAALDNHRPTILPSATHRDPPCTVALAAGSGSSRCTTWRLSRAPQPVHWKRTVGITLVPSERAHQRMRTSQVNGSGRSVRLSRSWRSTAAGAHGPTQIGSSGFSRYAIDAVSPSRWSRMT